MLQSVYEAIQITLPAMQKALFQLQKIACEVPMQKIVWYYLELLCQEYKTKLQLLQENTAAQE